MDSSLSSNGDAGRGFCVSGRALGKLGPLTCRKRMSPGAEQGHLAGFSKKERVSGHLWRGASLAPCPHCALLLGGPGKRSWGKKKFLTKHTPHPPHPGSEALWSQGSPSNTLLLPTLPVATAPRASLGSLGGALFSASGAPHSVTPAWPRTSGAQCCMAPSVGIYLPRGVGLCHRTTLSQHAHCTFLSAPSSWEQGV